MIISHTCCIEHPNNPPAMNSSQWQLDFCLTNACELIYPYQQQFKKTDRFLDIGCGEGFITAWLAKNAPHGSILGIDISETAIAIAKEKYACYNNLKFKVTDASRLEINEKFDWIVAFSSLHWLDEDRQLEFLKQAKKMLAADGKALFTLGMRHEPIWSIIEQIIQRQKWKAFLKNLPNTRAFFTKESYTDLLERARFTAYSLRIKHITHSFIDQQQFEHCVISWLPQVDQIPSHQKQEFISEISNEYLRLIPPNHNGNVEMLFRNLEVEAISNMSIPN